MRGIGTDDQTRCAHWHGETDVIALRFKCCGEWFPCFDCHAALTDHRVERWRVSEYHALAVLCGACGTQLSIEAYLGCGNTCPWCATAFNPGCRLHYHLYFETTGA